MPTLFFSKEKRKKQRKKNYDLSYDYVMISGI